MWSERGAGPRSGLRTSEIVAAMERVDYDSDHLAMVLQPDMRRWGA